MAGEVSRQATARSPLDFVACSRCRAAYSPSLSFYLTDCAHTLCQACTEASVAQSSTAEPGQLPQDGITCPTCGHAGPVIQLDHAPSLQHCFRPVYDLISELGMASEWQMSNLVEQLAFFRDKCAEQKKMLAKAAAELKKMRELKERLRQLEEENASLQQQLAAATAPSTAGPRTASDRPQTMPPRSLAQFSASHDQNMPPSMHPRPGQQGLVKQPAANSKRPRTSPDQFAAGPVTRSPSVAKAPAAPARLSLTPAQQKHTAARLSAQSASSRTREVYAAQPSAFDGQSSRPQSRPLPAQTEQSTKDRLARFAYDPSRQLDRSASAAPALGRHPTAISSYGQDGDSEAFNGALVSQNHAQEMTFEAHSGAAADSDPTLLDDRQLMPPPPVPMRRAIGHSPFQPQARGTGPADFAESQHFGSTFERPQDRFHAATSIGRPSTALGTAAPGRATPAAPTHRQPFRPASVVAHSSYKSGSNWQDQSSGGWSGASG